MVDHTRESEFGFHQSACPAEERVAAATTCKDMDKMNIIYDQWAFFYDEDMKALGFQGYGVMGKRIAELIGNKNAKILDIGCGTGRFGSELRSLGYNNIHAVDGNHNFLEKSRERRVYTELKQFMFGPNVIAPYEDGAFDTVVAVSSFGPGVVAHTAMPEISRLVATGGYLILFIRKSRLEMETERFNVKAVFEEWVASGKWERLSDISSVYYAGTDGVDNDDRVVERDGVIVTLRKLIN
ncbi:methyltransferase-like protein 27 [Strongylocentrotus purpuratus]|uniref:Methyltransferase type 11 domain-containing protein n=1 Tax=Strongylocentrotus purpuratus TaxID=7668 RepID=A0A7M7N5R5_STRPU|nr:methyltransferase-like protein 27 [Strongylocentrotus purpuratus]